MAKRISSRLAKVQAKKDRNQAILFILLGIAFILLLGFLGLKILTKIALIFDNIHSTSESITKEDTIPPIVPRLDIPYEATNSAQINITGQSEPGSVIFLIKNDNKSEQIIAGNQGYFVFKKQNLFPGDNTFQAYAKDNANNQSDSSSVFIVSYDKNPPDLKITQPKDNDKFYDENREILVAGETDSDIKQLKVQSYYVPVDTEGSFVKKILLIEGENEVIVTATDKAGNKTEKTVNVEYSR